LGLSKKLRNNHYTDEKIDVDFFDVLPCHAKQRQFIVSNRRSAYFVGGVGTGKTKSATRKALFKALEQPGETGLLLGRTGRDLQTTLIPSLFEDLDLFGEATGIQLVDEFSRGNQILTLINGSRIVLRPYDRVDKLRGINCSWAGADEIEYCLGDPLYSFQTIAGRVRQGKPNLRQIFITSTPNGLRGVIAHFLAKQTDGSPNYHVTHATCFDNPWIFDSVPCKECHGSRLSKDGHKCERCGGVGQASEYIDALREGTSKRMFRQEALGMVLKPMSAVFDEYDESRHLIPWHWDHKVKNWGLGIDWGTNHAYMIAVQFIEREERIEGRTIPAGSWIVADEKKCEGISRETFRQEIIKFIKSKKTLPYWVATDRAVKSENAWIKGAFPSIQFTKWCESKDEQNVRDGLACMTYMLDPFEGKPRLYFSDELDRGVLKEGRGIRGAMVNYAYKTDPRDRSVILDIIEKNNVDDHPVDALRYMIVTSARHEAVHGGTWLPYVMRNPVKI
jgi:hypothetical protein